MGRKRAHRGNTRRGRNAGVRRKPQALVSGTMHIVRPGMASVDTAEGTFLVARGGIREAMDGDEVQVALVRRGGPDPQAVVRSVMQRATSSFVGSFSVAGPLGVVVPLDARMGHDFFVLPDDTSAARLGVAESDIVEARILQYPARATSGVVTLMRRIGAADELDLAMESIIASHGLATQFSASSLAQAASLELDVPRALEEPLREDYRDLVTFTVDPTDARDYDDAVSAWRVGDGYVVQVHIADVTSYLGWDSPMDLEARQRTCSTYLADRVLPMLPERLCNDLCSLRPGEDRLAMSVTMRLDASGHRRSARVCPSVVRSRARLDYATVDAYLEGCLHEGELPCDADAVHDVAGMLTVLDEVAHARQAVRARRGALDFETHEAKVVLDEAGRPVDVRLRGRTRATNLIEEAMLLANEAVARMLADAEMPATYRVHERPAPESLGETLPALHELQLLQPGEAPRLMAGDPFVVQDVLARSAGTTGAYLASTLLLRAQKRAIYLPHNDGHYALGATAYCHFTSPIRRYPDVVVHRAVKALLAGQRDTPEQRAVQRVLPQLCRTCSDQERVADSAARDSQKVKMAQFYEGKIAERCSGIVSGCVRYGLFVTLDDTGAEGLLPVRALGEEWFHYDESRLMLTGESSGRSYRLGQRVAVEVAAVDCARGQIDFALAGKA